MKTIRLLLCGLLLLGTMSCANIDDTLTVTGAVLGIVSIFLDTDTVVCEDIVTGVEYKADSTVIHFGDKSYEVVGTHGVAVGHEAKILLTDDGFEVE